jgi:hypothetical protein
MGLHTREGGRGAISVGSRTALRQPASELAVHLTVLDI